MNNEETTHKYCRIERYVTGQVTKAPNRLFTVINNTILNDNMHKQMQEIL